ncbi:glycosyltransferase [Microvirga sp. BT689]|uniref:glycosyltransferase n=1 Tax=Microvirga arvi TaxID=2778731 RepID=UPI0019526FEC|nr:glycosyltransferase [Microvirga arvi]MBM6578753.1 glycosyltransferase [Microvirga arvi]
MIALSLISSASIQQGVQVTSIRESAGNGSVRLSETVGAHILYVVAVAALAAALPLEAYGSVGTGIIGAVGILAMWRYGWGLLHFVRALVFRKMIFPRQRKAADAAIRLDPPHAYLLVTTFRIDSIVTTRVYRAAFEAALAAPGKATIVASIVETGDQRLIKSLFQRICGDQDKVNLVIVRIAGTGKRDALAYGFRAVARQAPAPDDVVAVIDGDSIVPRDLVWKCAGFFRLDPAVGALTTDETSEVRGARIFQEWYALRFAQRHTLMSSVGLSERVLTLTGRMSMFRANIICSPEFIRQVELDYVDHWRLGRFKFLTGDDKSSWFWLLRNGYKMLYVPDVVVLTVEDPPSENFISAAAMLMVRWFGNMLRTNSRAVALGPWKIGLFTWWAILDQRMSMWTSLVGFAVALLAAIFISGYALLLYALWILASRYVLTLSLLAARPRVSVFYPFLLYFNQIFGSLIKVHVTFRLDRQKWTRQKTTSGNVAKRPLIASNFMSAYMHGLALTAFLTVLAWSMDVLPTPMHILP